VAVKDVPVHDDNRRRQLLRELKMLNNVGNALLPNDCLLNDGHENERMQTPPRSARRYPKENGYHPDDHHQLQHHQHRSKDPLTCSYEKMPNSDPCPYIVSCFDAYTDLANGSICLVLEFMNAGSLEGFIKAKAKDPDNVIIPESLIAMVADSVLGGLDVIHSRKQLHRDIKPSNILLDCSNNVKISDFGVGKELNSMSLANSFTGTLTYMSPERIAGNDYSYSSDVWSVGICLLALAQGKIPLPTNNGYWALVRAVQDDPPPKLDPPPEGHPAWSLELHSFLELCLIKDPDNRPLPYQLLQHPFLVNYRARASQIPGSPPVKPTPGLLSTLRQIAKCAAGFHAQKIIPEFDINAVSTLEDGSEHEQNNLLKKNKWIPDPDVSKLSSLALQLNMALDVVSGVFKTVWEEVNDFIDKHFDN
jgi:serine/threonine protein kinase